MCSRLFISTAFVSARAERVLRSGGSWRMLPREYPPWQTVYYHSRRWRIDGKDYERLPQSSEASIYAAMSRLMARRLARS
jgi:transposase